jgi:adenylate cyclase class IV
MHNFEIEIKSLLGSKEKADELLGKMKAIDPNLVEVGSHKQLNHYFIGGNLKMLYEKVKKLLTEEEQKRLLDISEKAKDFSVRTRQADGKVILVIKASVDDTTSSNGTARLEFEAKLNNFTLDKLDQLLLDCGFSYQAKWSRERQDYIYHPKGRQISVSIDKNAGYGFLSEFEVVVNDESKSEEVKNFIRESMADLSLTELNQDRLARMFEHYNKNWREYYGTEKIFNIE